METDINQGSGTGTVRPEPASFAPVVVQAGQGVRLNWLAGLTAVHMVLGVLCKESRWVGFAHGLGTVVAGLYLVFAGRPRHQIAYWAAYVVGAEILWRMSDAPLPWEFAKYAISLVLMAGLIVRGVKRVVWIPILYFLMLLPGAAKPLLDLPFSIARQYISFNLSGPLCVTVCAVFFSQVELDNGRVQRLLSWLITPVSGIAAVALFGLLTHTNIEFGSGSNFAATGGFGPNQVSGILGLGALYLVLMALSLGLGKPLGLALVLMALWFCAHAALSFSRSGIYLFGAALLAATPFVPLRRLLHPLTLATAGVAILLGLGAWAYMDHFTGGKLNERFANLSTTGRDRIAREDLAIWRQHLIFGAGLGMSSAEREEAEGFRVAAHTEYTRLLADHGLLGMFALLCLLVAAGLNVLRRRISLGKAVIVAGTAWAFLYLAVSGMRTAAPALLIGLGFVHITAVPLLMTKKRRGGGRVFGGPVVSGPVVSSQWSRNR